jgi:hypothetical protein
MPHWDHQEARRHRSHALATPTPPNGFAHSWSPSPKHPTMTNPCEPLAQTIISPARRAPTRGTDRAGVFTPHLAWDCHAKTGPLSSRNKSIPTLDHTHPDHPDESQPGCAVRHGSCRVPMTTNATRARRGHPPDTRTTNRNPRPGPGYQKMRNTRTGCAQTTTHCRPITRHTRPSRGDRLATCQRGTGTPRFSKPTANCQ